MDIVLKGRTLHSALMAGLLRFFFSFLVADDEHKPKTCVNMSIGMKHIVCIYCLLAFLKAQNNHYHSLFSLNFHSLYETDLSSVIFCCI